MLNMGVEVRHPGSVLTFPASSPLPGQVQLLPTFPPFKPSSDPPGLSLLLGSHNQFFSGFTFYEAACHSWVLWK